MVVSDTHRRTSSNICNTKTLSAHAGGGRTCRFQVLKQPGQHLAQVIQATGLAEILSGAPDQFKFHGSQLHEQDEDPSE